MTTSSNLHTGVEAGMRAETVPSPRKPRKQRLVKLFAAAIAATSVATALNVQPALAHSGNHVGGVGERHWTLRDDDGWWALMPSYSGAVDGGDWDDGEYHNTTFIYRNFSSTAPSGTIFDSFCHGGEVRGESRVTLHHANDGTNKAVAQVDLRLYEGTSCSTSDLDGWTVLWVVLSPGQEKTITEVVDNTAEKDDFAFGFDSISFTMTLRHS